MKTLRKIILLSGLLTAIICDSAKAATTIISDTYGVTTSGTGFGLNAGVNTGINPPTTRLTGSAAANLRYFQTFTSRPASYYDINSNRLRVSANSAVGRFVLSANGSTSFDFGPALGTSYATPVNLASYDVKISMRNDATANSRLSFGIATVEGDINNMDFGVQIFRASTGNSFYTIQKRIDRGSFNGTTTTDATGDVNATMVTAQAGTAATMMDFLIRVTDAGLESGANYNSRIQVSTNNGSSWIYDTDTDAAALNRFRFDGTARHFVFDQAGNTTGTVYYDAFSVTWNSGPRMWTGGGANGNWNTAGNWGGAVPASGDKLIFEGTTRQTNTNDLSGLSVPWLVFNNGGFALYGNAFTVTSAITNVTGNSTLNNAVTAGGTLRFQSDAGTLTLAGNIAGGAQNLLVDGLGNTTASGAISGTGSLTKGGLGTLTLSGASANTLSGNSIVNTGTLSLAKTAGVTALAGNMTIGDGVGGAGADVVRLGAANQIADTATLTVSASGNFDLNGFAETIASVSGASSSGQISLGAGTLTVGNGSAITFAGSISGTGNLVKQGSSSLTLSGANTFSGTATINAGTLNVQNASALGGSGATVVNSGTALEVQGGISIASEPLTLNGTGVSSAGALRNVSGNNSWSGAVTLSSAARINSDSGTLVISGNVGGGQNLSVGGAGNTTLSGIVSGAGSLSKDGSGLLQLSGSSANTYSGGTIVNAGTLSLAQTAGVDSVPGNLTIGDGAGTDVVQLGAANQISDSAAVTISAGGSLDLNGFSETVASVSSASASSQIALGAGTLTVGNGSANTFAGSISGTGNLVKQGAGSLALSGANTFSGTATISSGVLNVQNASALGGAGATLVNSGTALEIQGGISVAGEPLTLNGSGIGSAGALRNVSGNNSWSGAVTLASATRIHSDSGTLTISGGVGGGQSLTVGGAGNITLSGVAGGSVTKESTGILTLSGANTYSGNTTISAGTLALGTSGSIANSPTITIATGSTFDVSAVSGYSVGASQTLVRNATSGNGSVNGSVTLSSGAGVSLQANGTIGTLSVTGNLTVNGNTIAIHVTGAALGASTNTLITYTGSKSGSFYTTPTITGSGLVAGMVAEISESAGQINLRVYYNPTRLWSGGGANNNWTTSANWDGATPSNADALVFNGTTRQTSTNDISGLNIQSVTFNNGGFSLFGNSLTLTSAITNLSGNNTLNAGLVWGSSMANTWNIASGSEIILNNTTTIETNGDHTIIGGGTLRTKGNIYVGVATSANPAFIINEGKHIVDGGGFTSRGGYRIGSLATGGGAQTILTNGANFTLSISAGNLRVGDSANVNASRLLMNNSTLTMSGGILCIPFAASAIGEVNQTGGTVSGCIVAFNESGAGTGSYTIQNGTLEAIQVREDFTSGSSAIYFDNATLRTASGANTTFMTGINTAQIQSGGLTLEATSDVTVGQALSGTGALNKTGNNKITLTGANTYSGNTTITAGTLALGVGGSIAASPTITIVTGKTLDVSAISFAVGSSQTLARNSSTGAANINGSVTLGSGAAISLLGNGTSSSIGTFSITGNLTINANVISINVGGSALNAGTYPLITYTGTKSGSFHTNATITGSGIVSGLGARVIESAGQISLEVYSPGIPAHGIAAATLKVVENDLANTTNSVTVTTTMSINGLQMRDGSSRGDYTVQVGTSGTDDVNAGVMITSVAQNGADHGEDSGINYCTSALSLNSGGYFIPTCAAPGGAEYNINVSAAYFPYNKYLGGYARNSSGTAGGANNLLTASAGITLGTQFVDNGGGISTVNLTSLGINSQTDGVLLVTGGGNNNDYAASKANTNGTWTVYISDNGTNGGATTQGPVAFAYVPKSNTSVISGKFSGDGNILMHDGVSPRFSVANTTNGTWTLSIPGYSPSKGVLVISPEGGTGVNQDNILSFQPSGNNWIIQTRDLPGLGLQAHTDPVASFVFVPAPSIALVSPANNANISSSPTLTVSVTNNSPGNLTVTFHGHRLAKPGPGKDFMIAVLPDTQNYARENAGSGDAVKEMWFAQTDWIVNNRVSKNIAYVATLGDCVQNGEDVSEWKNATNAYYRLEKQSTTDLLDGIPYGVTVGNHDQEPAGNPDGTTILYNQYFGSAHFSDKDYYGGHYDDNNDNWYTLFSAGGLDFLVISFEYDRYGASIMSWARGVMAAHPTRRVIALTHFAGQDVADVNATTCPWSTQGQAIYEGLRTNANFFLMMSGHVFNDGGEGRRSDTFQGHTIRTIVSDYQGRFNGGNGLMRLMNFSPSNNLVSVQTYSPWTGSYETDANSQFTFTYNMQPNGAGVAGTSYAPIKTNVNVVPGTQTSFVWGGLTADRPYEWYVTVEAENGDYATSVEWKFNTTTGFAPDENPYAPFEAWAAAYGVTDPNADNDGDGQNNFAEFIAQTNPSDAKSSLRILDVNCDADGKATLTWSSVGGVRYRIQYADGIDGEFVDLERADASEMDASAVGAPSTQAFTDTIVSTNTVRFYRVKVVP